MDWTLLAGSLGAVLGLAGLAWMLRLGGATLADEAQAVRVAEDMLPGFEAEDAWLALGGDAALATGRDGSVALIRRHGARFTARRLIAPDFRQLDTFDHGGRIEIDSGERLWGTVPLAFESRWQAGEVARALAGAAARAGAAADMGVSRVDG